MKMVTVSEAALDSIQRMGEADKAEIKRLHSIVTTMMQTLTALGQHELANKLRDEIRVNHYSQTIARE